MNYRKIVNYILIVVACCLITISNFEDLPGADWLGDILFLVAMIMLPKTAFIDQEKKDKETDDTIL